MSAYQTFDNLPAALAAFGAEPKLCRRHVRIDGHVIDLVQAAAEASRVREEPAAIKPAPLYDRALVAKNIAAELARASEVLPELAVPSEAAPDASAYRCPWCSRPWDGVK